ncbi:MAG TPA: hypothetical protein VF377_10405 [Acidimicrobiia bacterium]
MTRAASLSGKARIVDLLLEKQGSNLHDWLSDRRNEGDSYEMIAKKIWVLTDGEVDVTYTTIRRWLTDLDLLEEAS